MAGVDVEVGAFEDERLVLAASFDELEAVDLGVPPQENPASDGEIPRELADSDAWSLTAFRAADAFTTEVVANLGLGAMKLQPSVVDAEADAFHASQ